MGAINAIGGVTGVQGAGSLGRASAADSLDSITGATDAAGASRSGTAGAAGGSFLDSLGQAFSQLNGQLTASDQAMAGFASGDSADVSSVMLQLQEASLNLKLGVQVRDGLLEAYREIMRLQV